MELIKLDLSNKNEVKDFLEKCLQKTPGMMIGVTRNSWITILMNYVSKPNYRGRA